MNSNFNQLLTQIQDKIDDIDNKQKYKEVIMGKMVKKI